MRRVSDFIWAALFIALLAAGFEVLILGFRRLVLGSIIWSSKHIVWMTPVAYLSFLLPPAIGAAVVAWIARRFIIPARLLPFFVALYAGISITVLLRLLGNQRLHWLSVAIIALGVAAQSARLVARDPARFGRIARRGVALLLAFFLTLTTVAEGYWWSRERLAAGRLPAAREGAPNIILIILDTVRAANLSLYGYPRPTTPELASIASRGVVFERAMATAPWTLTSHASMFTGRQAFELNTDFLTPLNDRWPTLAEVLQQNGYYTAGFAANHFYVTHESGLDRGFIHFEDYRNSLKQTLKSSELGQLISDWSSTLITRSSDATPAPVQSRAMLNWLSAQEHRPFFAFVNYMDAHLPYQTPYEFERRFAAGNELVDDYDAAIAYLDQQIGLLFRTLQERGLLDNTIVVIASDHGEQLGEHGLADHGNSLYTQLLHVPLIVVDDRRVPAGTRIAEPVSLQDIPATILSLAGVQSGDVGGRTLERLWKHNAADALVADRVLVADVSQHPSGARHNSWRNRAGPMRSVFQGTHHYIRNPGGQEELFDYWKDPAELNDLATARQSARILNTMRAAMDSLPDR